MESPHEGRRQTIFCLLPCFKLDPHQLESLVFFHIIYNHPICVCVFRTCNRRGADEDGKKRNVRDGIPKEVGGKLASVYCHVSNLILPFFNNLVFFHIIYNHPNMRIVYSEPATEEEQMKMGRRRGM